MIAAEQAISRSHTTTYASKHRCLASTNRYTHLPVDTSLQVDASPHLFRHLCHLQQPLHLVARLGRRHAQVPQRAVTGSQRLGRLAKRGPGWQSESLSFRVR
jgi:hypothetical protein